MLRGAKSIADKIDLGMILLQVSDEDKESLRGVVTKGGFGMPNIKMSVYKNRRGQYKDILLWFNADRSTCRFQPLFATDYQYKLIDIPELKITVNPKMQSSAF